MEVHLPDQRAKGTALNNSLSSLLCMVIRQRYPVEVAGVLLRKDVRKRPAGE